MSSSLLLKKGKLKFVCITTVYESEGDLISFV